MSPCPFGSRSHIIDGSVGQGDLLNSSDYESLFFAAGSNPSGIELCTLRTSLKL